ncbi:aldolase/citrate lyase family protein [Roseovarius sp. C7]|uniref:aldolase/citrate lyase family protein n=1 Tax=Roseovarius sp. C7 TaxID=3398643 RepID=UPI0039F74089
MNAELSIPQMMFLMIVNDTGIARFAHANGVARLFVDLEYMGKDIRQKGLDTWKSRQTAEDVTRIREAVPKGHLLVRVNPLHEGTGVEVEDVIARGADSIMLPMFHSRDELARFLDLVKDRAEVVPLVETCESLRSLPYICESLPVARVHIGLNDLHLDMGMDFMFQPFADGTLTEATAAMRNHGVKFGIGGIARAGEGIVSPEFLLGEHVRLGSDAAILSRTLHRGAKDLQGLQSEMDFPTELEKLQEIYRRFHAADQENLERNRIETSDRIWDVVTLIRNKRTG